LTLRSAGLKKGKKAPGEKLPAPDPGFQTTPSVGKISPARQDNLLQAQIADSSSRNVVSFSAAHTTKRFPPSLRLWLALFAQQMNTNRPFQFQKRSQLLICPHNETLPIIAMRVCNPNRSPLGINR
jgi:hypothetical protein